MSFCKPLHLLLYISFKGFKKDGFIGTGYPQLRSVCGTDEPDQILEGDIIGRGQVGGCVDLVLDVPFCYLRPCAGVLVQTGTKIASG